MKKFISKLFTLTVLFGVTTLYGQSFDIRSLDNRNNLNSLNFHKAATKLCRQFLQENDLTIERQDKSSYINANGYSEYGCHLCAEVIKEPFGSPLEMFVDRFLNDKRLMRNRSNAFTVRSIREEINTNYLEKYNQVVDSVDTENMVLHQYDLIKGYSFETNKLYLNLWNPRFKNVLPFHVTGTLINIPQLKGFGINDKGEEVGIVGNNMAWFQVPMAETKAQEIYARYSNHFNPNPPFPIATKLHYALRIGKEIGGKPRYFQVILKKVEFFIPNEKDIKAVSKKMVENMYDMENKIAEVTFGEKLYYTNKGVSYQEVRTIN